MRNPRAALKAKRRRDGLRLKKYDTRTRVLSDSSSEDEAEIRYEAVKISGLSEVKESRDEHSLSSSDEENNAPQEF